MSPATTMSIHDNDDEQVGLSLVQLPPELRSLADYLSVDPKPTAILRFDNAQHDDEQHEPVFANEAFLSLPSPKKELQDLRHALARSRSLDKDLHTLHNVGLDGGRWHTRVSTTYIIASAVDGRANIYDQLKQLAEDAQKQATPHTNGHAVEKQNDGQLNGHAKGGASRKISRDWTRYRDPAAPPSPWINFVRSVDWAATSVGPMETWDTPLRQHLGAIMANPSPRLLIWGDDWTFFYNEACVQLWGKKHPECMGQHISVAFAEAWPNIEPLIATAFRGETLKVDRALMSIERNGFLEETYWDFTILPICGMDGDIVGAMDEITEATLHVTGERRRNTISTLAEHINPVHTLPKLWSAVCESLETANVDLPFALLYEVIDDVPENQESESTSTESRSNAGPKKAVLVGSVGLGDNHQDAAQTFALTEHSDASPGLISGCLKAWQTAAPVNVSIENGGFPSVLATGTPGRGFGDPVQKAVISPIKSTNGGEVLAVLVTGMNPRTPVNHEYQLFLQISVDFIEKAAALISLPEEHRRTQRIADEINNALAQQLKMTTLQAERTEAKFSRLASTSPTGMFMMDSDGRPVYVNETFLEMLGLPTDEGASKRVDGPLWRSQVHDDDLDHFIKTWEDLKQHKKPTTIEYRLKKPWQSVDKSSGQEMAGESWILATAFPEIEADGSVSSIQGWITDISHRKFSEQLLSQRLEDALENKRQTENFIDMTSHELRNPLSAILQSADSIVSTLDATGAEAAMQNAKKSLSAGTVHEIIDAAQTIILCAQHQKRIVDDILTLSKLDASLLVISPEKVKPPMLVTKALKMYEAEIERAGIDAQLCIEPTYEELGVDWIFLDPSRLLQVIINLLTNSIKFTQYSDVRKIKICIGASYQKPSGKHHGISFVPVRHSRPPRTPMMERGAGEDIYLQFAVYDTGRGLNEDEMKVLFQRFSQASPKTYQQYGGSGLGLFISRELCELQGGQIGVASENGKTVFTFYVRAKRWVPSSPVMSQRPPVTRFSSASASPMAFSRRGSAVLQTIMDQMGPGTKENNATCEDFKPQPEQNSIVSSLVSSPTESEAANLPEMHVLIVEDNLVNQKVMSQQLRRAGCTVHVANHGLECLEFLEKSTFCSAATPLSIILLDLGMPTMDGLTCVRHIRERQARGSIIRHVPVIAVTANARSEQISFSLSAGFDQVITKPFRIPELLPQMQSLVAEFASSIANGT